MNLVTVLRTSLTNKQLTKCINVVIRDRMLGRLQQHVATVPTVTSVITLYNGLTQYP